MRKKRRGPYQKDASNSETQKRANCANVFMLMVLGQCIFWAFLGILKPKVGVSVRCSYGYFSKTKSELVLISTLFACLHVEVDQFVSRQYFCFDDDSKPSSPSDRE